MKQTFTFLTPIVILGALILIGCSSPYVVTHELAKPVNTASICWIGDIEDDFPDDVSQDKRPTSDQVQVLRVLLKEELEKRDIFSEVETFGGGAQYVVKGVLLDFVKTGNFFTSLLLLGIAEKK